MSESENVLEQEQVLIQDNPLRLVENEYLKIRTKSGTLEHLKLNRCQKALLNLIKKLRKERKPIRIWVLKSRQIGFSTLIEAIIFALTSQQPNRTALIMADEDKKSDNLFAMTKLYQEMLEKDEPHLAKELKRSNEKGLEWESIHSKIVIGTAKNPNIANSFTFQSVHLSEVALWDYFKQIKLNLMQTIPLLPDTLIIGETTARGMNEFYDEWISAVDGESDWIPFFAPWHWMEEYRKPLINNTLYPVDNVKFANMTLSEFLIKEEEAKVRDDLDLEQLNWRRYKIVNDCNKDVRQFMQEYPGTWEEAFSVSGDKFFDSALDNQEAYQPEIGKVIKRNMKYMWIDDPYGEVELYEEPETDGQYIITADASEAGGKDDASIFVGNRLTGNTCAVVYGQYTPDEQAEMCAKLGNYYNNALIAPETKGYGTQLTQSLRKIYGNVYYRGDISADIREDLYGFLTSSTTRPHMLGLMNEEIKQEACQLKSKRLIQECRWFIIKFDKDGKVKKVEAMSGKQDGLVICCAIFSYLNSIIPIRRINNTNYSKRAEFETYDRQTRSLGMSSMIRG